MVIPDTIYFGMVNDVDQQFEVACRLATDGDRYYTKDADQDIPQPTFTFVKNIPRELADGVMATGRCQVGSITKDGVDYGYVYYSFSNKEVIVELV